MEFDHYPLKFDELRPGRTYYCNILPDHRITMREGYYVVSCDHKASHPFPNIYLDFPSSDIAARFKEVDKHFDFAKAFLYALIIGFIIYCSVVIYLQAFSHA